MEANGTRFSSSDISASPARTNFSCIFVDISVPILCTYLLFVALSFDRGDGQVFNKLLDVMKQKMDEPKVFVSNVFQQTAVADYD